MTNPRTPPFLDEILDLIDSFKDYRHTAFKALKYPWRYAELYVKPYPDYSIRESAFFVLWGVFLCLVLYSPLVYKHGLQLTKLYFLLQQIYGVMFRLILIHFVAKICGGGGTLRQTAATYCTWLGVSMPIAWVAAYPLLYYVPIEDFIAETALDKDVPQWVEIWSVFCMFTMMIFGIIIMLKWIASVHGIRTWAVAVAYIFIYLPIYTLHDRYVAPIVSNAVKVLAEIGDIIIR